MQTYDSICLYNQLPMSIAGKIKSIYLHGKRILSFQQLPYHLFLLFVRMVSYAPFWVLHMLSDFFYIPLYYLVRYRRKIVRENLISSFPDKSLHDIKQIEKRFYHFLIDIALESCKLLSITPDELAKHMKLTNLEHMNRLLAEGKSISVFIGHYGNWEWVSAMALWLHKDATIVQIYHQLHNKAMDRIMRQLRERFGHFSVDMHKTARFMAQTTNDNNPYVIGFIADQSPRKQEAKHFVHFLHHEVPVLTGTEKVTKHYGYEAVYLRIRRLQRGYYEYEFIPLHDTPRSLPDFELTRLYYRQLENDIRQQPECYLWSHNRFKHAYTGSNAISITNTD